MKAETEVPDTHINQPARKAGVAGGKVGGGKPWLVKLDLWLAPFAAAGILALIGAIGIWTHHAWLVPSLGAAAFLQTMTPEQTAARPWNIVVGQLSGLGAGFAGVYAVGAQSVPSMISGHPLVWARVAAVAIAIAITVIVQHLLDAENPTAGATALLMALGSEHPTWQGAAIMLVGIVLVSLLGEAARFTILALKRYAAGASG